MIDTLRQWAMSLCAACVFCTILRILSPEGGIGKVYQTMLGVFLLCCMAAPFVDLDPSLWELQLDDVQIQRQEVADDLNEVLGEQQLELARQAVAAKVAAILVELDVSAEEIEVELSPQDNGTDYRCLVELLLREQDEPRQQEIAASLKYQLGVEARFAYCP